MLLIRGERRANKQTWEWKKIQLDSICEKNLGKRKSIHLLDLWTKNEKEKKIPESKESERIREQRVTIRKGCEWGVRTWRQISKFLTNSTHIFDSVDHLQFPDEAIAQCCSWTKMEETGTTRCRDELTMTASSRAHLVSDGVVACGGGARVQACNTGQQGTGHRSPEEGQNGALCPRSAR
jgi:hypothetical protein